MSKKITQQEFDAIPEDDNGIKQCPGNTDYSYVKISGLCSFGERCSFGEGCSFGERCSFGEGCSFGEVCSFGERCSYNNHKLLAGYPALGFWGAGSANRGMIAWNTEDGIIIRCGCFEGELQAFRDKVRATHGVNKHALVYLGFANLCAAQFDRMDLLDFDFSAFAEENR